MKVGLSLPQSDRDGAGTWNRIEPIARHAEAGGIDSLWVCDHFFFREDDGTEVGLQEALTLLSAVAAVTSRVELGTLVLATSFRSPGLTARIAATLDDVSGGRLILGVGCGWYEPEYAAFGYPFDHRVGRFEEALAIIAPLLRGERVTRHGEWYSVDDAAILPAPSRRIPILVASRGDRMLRLTARHADRWQAAWFGRPNARFREQRDDLFRACEAEQRDPASVEIHVGVEIDEPGAEPNPERSLPSDAGGIADGLAAWAEHGVAHVQVAAYPVTTGSIDLVLEAIRRFRG